MIVHFQHLDSNIHPKPAYGVAIKANIIEEKFQPVLQQIQ